MRGTLLLRRLIGFLGAIIITAFPTLRLTRGLSSAFAGFDRRANKGSEKMGKRSEEKKAGKKSTPRRRRRGPARQLAVGGPHRAAPGVARPALARMASALDQSLDGVSRAREGDDGGVWACGCGWGAGAPRSAAARRLGRARALARALARACPRDARRRRRRVDTRGRAHGCTRGATEREAMAVARDPGACGSPRRGTRRHEETDKRMRPRRAPQT